MCRNISTALKACGEGLLHRLFYIVRKYKFPDRLHSTRLGVLGIQCKYNGSPIRFCFIKEKLRPYYGKTMLPKSNKALLIRSSFVYFTVFRRVPMPSTVTSTISPCFRKPGSFIPFATPAGVPVAIISPGSNVIP